MKKQLLCLAALSVFAPAAFADKIVLKNGDTLNGKIGLVTENELSFTSPAFPEVKIPLSNIEKYEFDQPTIVDPRKEPPIRGENVDGTPEQVNVDQRSIPAEQVKSINAPAAKWTGTIVANSALARGNTNNFVVGIEANAARRRELPEINDRITSNAAYNFGRSGGGSGDEPETTDVDNWLVAGKYDYFFTEKNYAYANVKLEHDAIAELYYRVTPGVGVGYQWMEGEWGNFNTEVGATYVREDFSNNGINEFLSVRLAYHYDWKINDRVSIFHNLEFLPAVENFSDYVLTTDAGLRTDITKHFFTQFKILYKRDSTPAPGTGENDVLYTVGVGWSF